ncbi:acyltransferase family protein [Rhizorhabdus argentea]|uniref:acyltransferase family protein n=1 Tax=Rhizorhabdus argentea TaxID=1387174 RepID=UPI0030EB93E7
MTNATATEGGQHFLVLDAMRGVAALMIGCLHAGQLILDQPTFGHAYLAVDFFFCLSGFVVAYAYQSRLLSGMSIADFVVRRMIRLWPLIILGAGLGTMVMIGGDPLRLPIVSETLFLGVLTTLLLPGGLLIGVQAYPPNNPVWSLFFEVVANIVYGVTTKLRRKVLLHLSLIFSLVALVLIALVFDGLQHVGYDDPASFLAGFARVGYPFIAGVAIYSLQLYSLRWRVSAVAILAVLTILLVWPYHMNASYDLVCIVMLFPILIILGSTSKPTRFLALYVFLGEISYPFYLLHQPILRMMKHVPHSLEADALSHYILPSAGILIAVFCSMLALRLYDMPLRRWLTSNRTQGVRLVPIR